MYNNQTTEQTTTKGITGSKLDRVQYLLIISTASTRPSKPVWKAWPFGYELMLWYDEYDNMGHEKLSLRVIVPSAVTV